MGHDFAEKRVTLCQSSAKIPRCTHENVEWKWRVAGPFDFNRLIKLVTRRHDDEDIDVAVLVRGAVGVRAEQDDLLRIEALGHLARELADLAHRDIRTAIPALWFRLASDGVLLGHVRILHDVGGPVARDDFISGFQGAVWRV